jgi:hypothetical protein
MRNRIIRIFSLVLVTYTIGSCTENNVGKNGLKEGDIVVKNKDTFDVHIDTHRIVTSIKLRPINALQEASPVWLNTTDKDSTFKSFSSREIGSTQIYQILKRRK